MVATHCPTNFLALTEGVGRRLDRSQSSQSTPIFWIRIQFLRPRLGEPPVAETSAKILASPDLVGQAWALSKQSLKLQSISKNALLKWFISKKLLKTD